MAAITRALVHAALVIASVSGLRAPKLPGATQRLGGASMASSALPASLAAPRERSGQRQALNLRIDGEWYDLSLWRAAHPSGAHWIDGFANADATEVVHAFHSGDAAAMLKRLPKSKAPPTGAEKPPDVTPLMTNFRTLRAELEAEGWFERVWWREAQNLLPVAALYAAGTWLARRRLGLATLLLALGSTAAGWVGHDYVHGRGRFCRVMRGFAGLTNGHSATWWSNKHNLHHACTNLVGVDEDIMSDPFFYLWAPDPKADSKWRRTQHLHWPLVYSSLFALWRFNSLRTLRADPAARRADGVNMAINYAWMALFLPLRVAVGHVFLAGAMTAAIVTVTHQTEDLFHSWQHDWVSAQLRSTRNAVTSNPFSEWLWGGMQYQLEHHLFPTMPRYRYPALVPRLKAFCEENGVEYREDGEAEIFARNLRMLRDVGAAPAVDGAPPTRATEKNAWNSRRGAALTEW